MRTNIELNDDLVAEAQKYSKAKSKRALVEEALATFIAVKVEDRRRRTYKERLESLRNRTRTVRLRSDTRDILRKDRDSR
ncbi:MAG: type II toxin-antitoxin system VapB family antitoxin [Deltaproteobacteria bacterium]|nr:type II toxin-antitoxin system VapB family antitoxin [Deltaproteobacteria bacterium]MBW1961911.1 type II toxin-antitoxin system VapB family antitoxin [Deltaproteobacteria bacterium]MBW2153655.1 type II toxin-antitoxin system VapB family antitoxin [Deltaproteobacteria bacterium]